jgi:hypothetical protein
LGSLIIRVDDVSPNTEIYDLNLAAHYLKNELGAEIWYCVNMFAKNTPGSVYPHLPMRGRGINYFCDVDKVYGDRNFPDFVKVVSHGLIHAEHGELEKQTQYFSIMTSCNFLNTKIFVPPFMSYNSNTKEICDFNGIELVEGGGWKSMETEKFDPSFDRWYFHHWRMDFKKIEDWVRASKIDAQLR